MKKTGLLLAMALVLALASAVVPKANAEVVVGVTVGGTGYVHPVRPYGYVVPRPYVAYVPAPIYPRVYVAPAPAYYRSWYGRRYCVRRDWYRDHDRRDFDRRDDDRRWR